MTPEEIRKYLENKKVVFGARQAVKHAKLDNAREIFLSGNCEPQLRNKLVHYSTLSELKVQQLQQNSDELSIALNKDFGVNVLTIVGEHSAPQRVQEKRKLFKLDEQSSEE